MKRDSGGLLREARLRTGMSQAELARRARVTQPVISAYETGRREPALSTLARLVEATGQQLVIDLAAPASRVRLPDTPIVSRLRQLRGAILTAAARRGASNVRVFGSVARGEDTESSDVDLLVDLDESVSLVSLIGLERELAEIIGRDVDVIPAANLKSGIAGRLLAEAIDL